MTANASGQSVDSLPAQGQFARRLHAEVLAGDLQGLLGHDFERPLAHVAEGRGVVDRLVDVEQQQAPDLRGVLLPPHLFSEKLLVGLSLALVFELLGVVAQRVDEIVGELLVALLRVAEQVQIGLLGFEVTQVVGRVEVGQTGVVEEVLLRDREPG